MTDAEIVEMYNQILDSQWALLEAWDKTVVEEPPGEKQIDYHENSDQWVPLGDVLRCIIDDGGPDGEVVIHIDDQELSLREFGRLLRVHAGWGMRIAFVPEEFVTENPTVKVRKAQKRKRRVMRGQRPGPLDRRRIREVDQGTTRRDEFRTDVRAKTGETDVGIREVGGMRLGPHDGKLTILITRNELHELKRCTVDMAEAFGLDRGIES